MTYPDTPLVGWLKPTQKPKDNNRLPFGWGILPKDSEEIEHAPVGFTTPAAKFKADLERNQRAARAQDVAFAEADKQGLTGVAAVEFALESAPAIELELHRAEVVPKITGLVFDKLLEEA